MSRTFRSYVANGERLTLTAFVGPEGDNRNSSQFTLLPEGDYVKLHSGELEPVMRALQNRVTLVAGSEGNASPLLIYPAEEEGYEIRVALGAENDDGEAEWDSYIALTETQVEDMIEALQDRLEGKDWTSATTWESFYRVDEDGEKTEMYEPGVAMEEHESKQEQEVA
jgi:hypothetical protein